MRKEAPLPLGCSHKLPPGEVDALLRVARRVHRVGPSHQDDGLQRQQLRGQVALELLRLRSLVRQQDGLKTRGCL